jgi:hypothetical protein
MDVVRIQKVAAQPASAGGTSGESDKDTRISELQTQLTAANQIISSQNATIEERDGDLRTANSKIAGNVRTLTD